MSLADQVTLLLLNSVHTQKSKVGNGDQPYYDSKLKNSYIEKEQKILFSFSMHSTSVSIYHNTLDIAVIIHFLKKNVARICIIMFTILTKNFIFNELYYSNKGCFFSISEIV